MNLTIHQSEVLLMRSIFFLFFTILLTLPLSILHSKTVNYPPRFVEKAEKKEIVTSIRVTTEEDKKQSLDYQVMGLHPQSCASSFRILSRYENFPHYLSFLKKSQYNEKTNDLALVFDSELLPFPLYLNFKLPRIRGVGDYPFTFPTGFFPGLKGIIHVRDHSQMRCLIYVEATWTGDKSKIASSVLEIFLITISKQGMEKLIRISTL